MSNKSQLNNKILTTALLNVERELEPTIINLNSNATNRYEQNFHKHAQNQNLNGDAYEYLPLQSYLQKRVVPKSFKNENEIIQKYGKTQVQKDFEAMSVLSLLDDSNQLDFEMDTNRDLVDIEIPNPKINEDTNETSSKTEYATNSSQFRNESGDRNDTPCSLLECPKPNIYFKDDKRSVDFVLVWDSLEPNAITDESISRRKMFEDNLIQEGLELEYEPRENNGLNFLKIHVPQEVLQRYGEILKLRMPMKEELCNIPKGSRQSRLYSILAQKILGRQTESEIKTNPLVEEVKTLYDKFKAFILVDTDKFPEKSQRFTAIYSRDKEYLFDVDSPCFFTPAIHSRIVQFILDRKRFSENPKDDFAFGIERLLNEKVYSAAYPLHDGDLDQAGTMRNLLHTEWATLKKWYTYQPLDYVKEYFGIKIALYFAWLGFYTHMLVPAAVVGLICFIYSCCTIYQYKPSKDICDGYLNITMCPQCDYYCDQWDIRAACTQARITYLFDNGTTVFFAIFMSIWATIFLEMWKRYSAEITHRWDVTGFDIREEHPRPQYLARLSHVKRKQINIITNTMEPHVPFWKLKVPATIFSFSIVLLLITLAFATVAAVILYRMSVLTALRIFDGHEYSSSYAMLFTSITAATINLCCIFIFNWIYYYVAEYLTELEYLRTQTQFDDSLTLKIYLLQFVNYYASIFYIAFFKGKFVGHPNEYNTFFGYRQEECNLGSCLMELSIQLGIIMIGKQAMNTILEMLFPLFYKWMNTLKIKTGLCKKNSFRNSAQWIKDFKLVEWGPRSLFHEYLEMVLQYGFVTIFVSAFPLAPFFALINNILEMRLDARKLLAFYRRPITQRVRDIGVWIKILDSISKISVVTNGFIIAFTTDFIPRFVYSLHYSENYSLDGYLNFSLSIFNASSNIYNSNLNSASNAQKVEICRYADYREPPGSPKEYRLSLVFWHILAAKLAFIVIFENAVAFIIILVKWIIPDMPKELRDKIRRETYITNEIVIKQEAIRARTAYHSTHQSPVLARRVTLGLGACPTTPSDWDQIIHKSLSETDFDLLVHSTTYPTDSTKDCTDGELRTPTSV